MKLTSYRWFIVCYNNTFWHFKIQCISKKNFILVCFFYVRTFLKLIFNWARLFCNILYRSSWICHSLNRTQDCFFPGIYHLYILFAIFQLTTTTNIQRPFMPFGNLVWLLYTCCTSISLCREAGLVCFPIPLKSFHMLKTPLTASISRLREPH